MGLSSQPGSSLSVSLFVIKTQEPGLENLFACQSGLNPSGLGLFLGTSHLLSSPLQACGYLSEPVASAVLPATPEHVAMDPCPPASVVAVSTG